MTSLLRRLRRPIHHNSAFLTTTINNTNHPQLVPFHRRCVQRSVVSFIDNNNNNNNDNSTIRNNSSISSHQSITTTTTTSSSSPLPEGTQIQILGGRNEFDALKRYILVQTPTNTTINTTNTTPSPPIIQLASIYAKRNILFGTTLHDKTLPYESTCRPILELALIDASQYGDQPQGLANLTGLSDYVNNQLLLLDEESGDGDIDASPVLTQLHPSTAVEGEDIEEKRVVYDAIRAVATQIPREGHSVVGFGTYRDARSGWTELAREYATLSSSSSSSSSLVDVNNDDTSSRSSSSSSSSSREAGLFLNFNGIFSQVEYNGDADEAYLKEAGGAMARFFFL